MKRSRKRILIILIAVFLIAAAYIIACVISDHFYKNSQKVISSYDTEFITETELENIVKIKFMEDCIDKPEINLTALGNQGVPMGDWTAAPYTQIGICYEVYEETLHNREYYAETSDTIKGKLNFNNEIYNIIDKYDIDEDNVEYVNVKYGTCSYDITNGVNYADYYVYAVVEKVDDRKYRVAIGGTYPYPIEME